MTLDHNAAKNYCGVQNNYWNYKGNTSGSKILDDCQDSWVKDNLRITGETFPENISRTGKPRVFVLLFFYESNSHCKIKTFLIVSCKSWTRGKLNEWEKKKIEIHFLPITNSCVETQSGSTNSVTIGFLLENSPFISNEAGQITFSFQWKYHERTRTPTKSLDLKRRWGITSWEEDSFKLKLIKINLISGHRQTRKSSSTFLSPSFVRTRGMDVKIWRSSSEI